MSNADIVREGQKYIMNTYARLPIAMVKGEGCYVYDADGRKYLDFVAGIAVNALGHAHPAVAEALSRQAGTIIHCSNLYWIEPQVAAAKLLVENSCLDKVFFANSGAEANEAAIKLARKYAKAKDVDKYEIITMYDSFHGRTMATLAATGQARIQNGYDPLLQGFKYVPFNDIAALREAVSPRTCAVMLEPVQGEGGVIVAEDDYLRAVRELCDEHDMLLIFDEVQVGLGRTGKLFAYQHSGVEPDIMTLAKALGGGAPVAAMLAKDKVAASFQPGDHASTFGGNPLVTAAAKATLEVIIGDNLPANAAKMGAYLQGKLTALKAKYPFIQYVRGKGLLVGLVLDIPGAPIVAACLERGLLINCTAGKVLRFVPPLIVSQTEIDKMLVILEEALATV